MIEELTFPEFVACFERCLKVTLPEPTGAVVIGVDVPISSSQMMDMIVELEDLGAELPPEIFLEPRSLDDLYEQYRIAFQDGGFG